MAIYIVSYDLSASAYEDDLLKYLKSGDWARATKSAYVIVSNKTPEQIVNDVRRIANDQIHVYVFTVTNPYYGFGDTEVNEWLGRHF